MNNTEHLIENALVAVTSGKTVEEYKEQELSHGGNIPSQLLDMVYEMAQYVHYTWNEGKVVNSSFNEFNVDEIKAGDRFTYVGLEYVCLEVFGEEVYGHKAMLAVTAEIIKNMEFSEKYEDGCNDWRISKVRTWLNNDFLAMHIFKDDVIPQTVDLTADNGDDAYGKCEDYVTLLSCDQYRRCRKLIPKYDDWVWTVTPYSCTSGIDHSVRNISPSGELVNNYAVKGCGVAPACLFNLDNQHLRQRINPVHKNISETKNLIGGKINGEEF